LKSPQDRQEEVREKVSGFSSFVLFVVSAVAVLSVAFLVSYGLDPNLAKIVYGTFFIWPAYLLYIKAHLTDLPRAFLQTIRAATYMVSFVFLIPMNSLVVTPTVPLSILLTPVVSLVLVGILMGSFRYFYEEVKLFDSVQVKQFSGMIVNAGVACIWLSCAIAFLNLGFVFGSVAILEAAVPSGILMSGITYWNERKSAKSMKNLAESLTSSGWPQRVDRARRSKELRRRRLSKGKP
jgi:hypothetical protein